MNKYIVPICDITDSNVYVLTIMATSISDCEDKIMDHFSEFSNAYEYNKFLEELDSQDILIGEIIDVECL